MYEVYHSPQKPSSGSCGSCVGFNPFFVRSWWVVAVVVDATVEVQDVGEVLPNDLQEAALHLTG